MKWRLNFFANIDREQEWLNRLSKEGWELKQLKLLGMLCGFEPCNPEQYQYLIEIEPRAVNTKQGQSYQQFLADMGVICVGSCLGCSYYKKENDGTVFELYSDRYSKIAADKRKAWIYGILTAFLLVEMIILLLPFLMKIITVEMVGIMVAIMLLNIGVFGRFLWLFCSMLKKLKKMQQKTGEQNEFLTAEEAKKQRTFFTPMMRYLFISVLVGAATGAILGIITVWIG